MKLIATRHERSSWLGSWVCLGLVLLAMACPAATHYVVPPGTIGVTPADPYTSWATAGTNIDDVVTAAQTNTSPRMVLVTNGTYYLTNAIDITRAITVKGVNGRDNTFIDGNAPNYTNYAFYVHMAAGQVGVLDGLSITNCWDGGLRLGARAVIQNCLIADCKNINWPATLGARNGGGIFTDVNAGALIISNCIVRANTATIYGGGINVAYGNSGTVIVDSLIEDNDLIGTEGGGGICVNHSANVSIRDCIIRGNEGRRRAGGIYVFNVSANCSITDCTIVSNNVSLIDATGGGGIAARANCSFTASGCVFRDNTTLPGGPENRGGRGGAIHAQGSSATIRNCLISGNQADMDGGGIWCEDGIIENCTVVTNQAGLGGTGYGGGIYMDAADGAVTGINNIVYFNTADAADNFTNIQGNVNLSYSCVSPAVSGTDNITDDPKLVDPAGGDYRLANGSPCYNTGIYRDWMTNAYDLDGVERIIGGVVDMGAYESDPPPQGTIFLIR